MKPSEQIIALLLDVQALEAENVRLNAALAKCSAELYALKTPKGPKAEPHRKVMQLSVLPLKPKTATLEDDVRRWLGMAPFVGDKLKNDKRFLATLDERYGPVEVDVMIKRLRSAQ